MGNPEEAQRWLDQGEAGLKTARDCRKDGNFYAAAFFAQQAGEKALKSVLLAKGWRGLLTRSLYDLVETAMRYHPEVQRLTEPAKELDRHYIGARYPNVYPAGAPYRYYDEETAKRCISYAELILTGCKKSTGG